MLAAPALAHEDSTEIQVTLDPLPVALAAMDVAVVTSVAEQVVLSNPSARAVEVLDDDATPFLRIGPGGVEANLNAAAWYLTNNPLGLGQVPTRARAGAPPDWARVAVEPSWGWFDHRLHPEERSVPNDVRQAGRAAELARWSVPLRVDGAPTSISGSIRYQPVRGSVSADITDAPAIDGLNVATLPGRAPGIFLDNGTGRRVVVLGGGGEPFLRFGRRTVEVNRFSPAWLEARRAEAEAVDPAVVDASRAPQWREVSRVPRFGWIDPRAAYPAAEPPASVVDAGRPATLRTWSIALRVGQRDVVVRGENAWQPYPAAAAAAPADGGAPPRRSVGSLFALAGGAGGVAWLVVRHRRHAKP